MQDDQLDPEQQSEDPTPSDQPAEQPLANKRDIVVGGRGSHRKVWLGAIVLLLVAIGLAYWLGTRHAAAPTAPAATTHTQKTPATTNQRLTLDTSKDYGNKYKDGILPVGDGKYTTTGAKAGYVYTCSQYAQNLASQPGGAMTRGPWFNSAGTEYDINKKSHVQGDVMWSASFSNKVSGNTRTIVTNDLPDHPTGIFPILSSDPAYQYDRNPNTIKSQSFTYALTTSPSYGNPNCIGGQVGIMLTGVALFSAFDAGGRDAGAWEVQDNCNGHPQSDGIYHYHTLSSCIKDTSVRTVIGYALDGFPITGPQVASGNILTSADLDVCHGITSSYVVDGKTITGYHYVMTQDFPYSIACYHGTAIQPPGQQEHVQSHP